MLQTNQQADTIQFMNYLQDTHFLLVSVQGSQPVQSAAAASQVERVCCRIPRVVPGPVTTQAAGTFVFLIKEDAFRRSHLIFTLAQFTRPSSETGLIAPEEKLLKRYIDSRKKEYLEFVKENDHGVNTAVELKQTATRVTIEGEHVCLFVVRKANVAAELAFFDSAAIGSQP